MLMKYAVPTNKVNETVLVIVKVHYAEDNTALGIVISIGATIGTIVIICSPCIVVS